MRAVTCSDGRAVHYSADSKRRSKLRLAPCSTCRRHFIAFICLLLQSWRQILCTLARCTFYGWKCLNFRCTSASWMLCGKQQFGACMKGNKELGRKNTAGSPKTKNVVSELRLSKYLCSVHKSIINTEDDPTTVCVSWTSKFTSNNVQIFQMCPKHPTAEARSHHHHLCCQTTEYSVFWYIKVMFY